LDPRLDPTEKLTIETPEQILLEFPMAGIGSRGLALGIDTIIQAGAVLVVVLVVALVDPDLSRSWVGAWNWVQAVELFLFFCLYWGYFAVFEILWNGQTPGKRQVKIRVISASGRPVTAFEGIARNFLRAIDSLGFYLVGCIACAIDRKNRRLGDMVAGTVVVHEVEDVGNPYWYSNDRAQSAPAISQSVIALTREEFLLVETFLSRRIDLSNLQRLQAAQQIAARIGGRLNIPPQERSSDEDFLEEVSRRYRDAIRHPETSTGA
jgi:uncharacterized RDD family membrane protein YckC